MNNPIYTALVSEGFDPHSVAPIPSRASRKQQHDIWAAKTWHLVKRGPVPVKRRTRKQVAS